MDKESGKKIYGVLGYPAKHSLSPVMHNTAFEALKIKAEYKIFEIKPYELGIFLKSLSDKNIHGLNVTIPYKEKVLDYLQWKSPEVRFTGASNTIVVEDKDILKGWNTDGIGFHRHLTKDLKFDISGKRVIIVGAGGAAKAVTNQLARCGARSMAIFDIDKNKSSKLVDKLNKEFPKCNVIYVDSADGLDIKNTDLLINATPVGMKEDDSYLINPDLLHSHIFVYDLIYNPKETKLLRIAREKGADVSNGLGMLLYQGVRSFEIWTGKKAPVDIMRKQLMEAVCR